MTEDEYYDLLQSVTTLFTLRHADELDLNEEDDHNAYFKAMKMFAKMTEEELIEEGERYNVSW
jgi:hypothetical protein